MVFKHVILATGWLVVDPVTVLAVSLLAGWPAFDRFRSALYLSGDSGAAGKRQQIDLTEPPMLAYEI